MRNCGVKWTQYTYGNHLVHLYVYWKPSISPATWVRDNWLFFLTVHASYISPLLIEAWQPSPKVSGLTPSTKSLLYYSPPSDWQFYMCVSKLWTTTSSLSLVDWPHWETSQMGFWSGRLNLLFLLSTAMASATPPESLMNGAMASRGDHKKMAAGTAESPTFFFCHLRNKFILHLKKIW